VARPMKPFVGVDLDGCLYNWDATARELLQNRGVIIPSDPSQYWDQIRDQITEKDWKWLWSSRGARQRLFEDGSSFPDGIGAVRELQDSANIVIVTKRPRDVTPATLRWLADQELLPHTVVHVPPGSHKHEIMPRCATYVEDNPSYAEGLAGNLGVTVHLPRRTWNEELHFSSDGLIRPFDRWSEVTQWVKKHIVK